MHPALRRLLLVACLLAPSVHAANVEPGAETTVLETVVVSGRQPGPGLWKVSKDGHVMWLLGTISPLPKRMEWTSEEVEATIAKSQALLMPPGATVQVKTSMFGALFLMPSAMKARNNPDKQTLSDVLPEEDYARWSRLKQRYLGRNRGVEKRRPVMAAAKLEEEAMDDSGLSTDNLAATVARRTAKRHDVPIVDTSVKLVIEDPKAMLRELSDTKLDDLDCFRRTLVRLESELETMKLRANAWALGEVDILRSLPHTENNSACVSALMESRIARKKGLGDLEPRISAAWLEAATKALTDHERSFALLPMRMMLSEDGLLAQLEQRGYQVEAPAAAGP